MFLEKLTKLHFSEFKFNAQIFPVIRQVIMYLEYCKFRRVCENIIFVNFSQISGLAYFKFSEIKNLSHKDYMNSHT